MSPDPAPNPLERCLERLDALSDILMQWLDAPVALIPAEPEPYNTDEPNEAFGQGPWLGIAMGEGAGGTLAAISNSVLPAGVLEPDDNQYRGLVEVARSIVQVIAPDAAGAGKYRTGTLTDLAAEVAGAKPSDATRFLVVAVAPEGGSDGTLILVGPLADPMARIPERQAEAPATPVPEAPAAPSTTAAPSAAAARESLPPLIAALLKVPVPVSVTLAEKKMPVGQILALGPGMIVQFEKSCDELIDLKVNWHGVGKGEAMKVGEKFGIKITEINSPEQRAALLAQGARSARS